MRTPSQQRRLSIGLFLLMAYQLSCCSTTKTESIANTISTKSIGVISPIWFLWMLILVLMVVGILYLFYPALVAAARRDDKSAQNTLENIVVPMANNDPTVKPILTVVIPAYNEEMRLPNMLQDAFLYLSSSSHSPALTKQQQQQQQQQQPVCRALHDLLRVEAIAATSSSTTTTATKTAVEWIVVNDGSKDQTVQAYRDFVAHCSNRQTPSSNVTMIWKCITLPRNTGKGAAVQTGMLAGKGTFLLMVDADGATTFGPGLEALTGRLVQHAINNGNSHHDDAIGQGIPQQKRPLLPIILGSRAHLTGEQQPQTRVAGEDFDPGTTHRQQVQRSWIRQALANAFHALVVWTVGVHTIQDTQCGFKLFPQEQAQQLFGNLHLQQWAFDTEIIYLATHIPSLLSSSHVSSSFIDEVPVPWHEVEGSKLHTSTLHVVQVAVNMLRDMICVRACYSLGIWKIRQYHGTIHETDPSITTTTTITATAARSNIGSGDQHAANRTVHSKEKNT